VLEEMRRSLIEGEHAFAFFWRCEIDEK